MQSSDGAPISTAMSRSKAATSAQPTYYDPYSTQALFSIECLISKGLKKNSPTSSDTFNQWVVRLRAFGGPSMSKMALGGKASVQVMYRNAQTGSAYAQSGYEASYGSYQIDDSSTFTFHIDGALVKTLIGRDLKRACVISGNRLTVKSTDGNERWKVVWGRY